MNVMKDFSEIVEYNCFDIPVYIKSINLSDYPYMRVLCHWHQDIEIIYVTEGEMNYHINDKTVLLRKNDCLIINSRQLHHVSSLYHHTCIYVCIRFHPKLLYTDPSIYQTYVAPLIENSRIDYLYYNSDSSDYPKFLTLINNMIALKKEMHDACELDLLSAIHLFWRTFYLQCRPALAQKPANTDTSLFLQKKMVAYIYDHYQEPLTLDEIAASADISRSKCCIVFKQYLEQSPVDFLNKYRLAMSAQLLLDTQSSITEIALSCGFNHLSYFSKIFLREYGCTPTEYRKKQQSSQCLT